MITFYYIFYNGKAPGYEAGFYLEYQEDDRGSIQGTTQGTGDDRLVLTM